MGAQESTTTSSLKVTFSTLVLILQLGSSLVCGANLVLQELRHRSGERQHRDQKGHSSFAEE